MRITLKSETASVQLDTHGGELVSFQAVDGTEYLWQGDPTYWKGQSPVLFPMVGRLRNDKALIEGKEYSMKRHGIARNREFTLVSQTEDTAVFRLESDPETLKEYPYHFVLQTEYRLEGNSLIVGLRVKNAGGIPMPFAVGGHPAFRCPLEEGESFEDYRISFEMQETVSCPAMDLETGLIDPSERRSILQEENVLRLSHDLFQQDALVLEGLRSGKVWLSGGKAGRGMELEFSQFPYLGVWSALGDAPFVALEPWTGTATLTTEGDEFEKKQGTTILGPGGEKLYTYCMTAL